MKKLLIALALGLSSFSTAQAQVVTTTYDYDAISLANIAEACSAQIQEAKADKGTSNVYWLLAASSTKHSDYDMNEHFVLKYGVADPMIGMQFRKQVVGDKTYKPYPCPSDAADCGGGTFSYGCKVENL